MSDHFITEFGHKIDFVPGYYERNRFYADFARRQLVSGHAYDGETLGTPVMNYMLARDWVLFSGLVKFLERNGLLQRWQSGIDLGGAEGTIIRLFKAAGLIQHATNVDIADFSATATEDVFRSFMAGIRDRTYFGPHAMKSVEWAKIHQAYYGDLIENFPEAQDLDCNLVMRAEEVTDTYDLITANALMEFVDLDVILPKLRTMLRKGGLIVGSFNAAWCPIVPSGILGDFPYAFQRLTLEDARRYFSEHHAEQITNLETRYNWFHKGKYRPTLSDWFALIQLYGMRIVAFERVSSPAHERYFHTPAQLVKERWFNIFDVLRDVHCINDAVTIDDLMTTSFRMAITVR